MDQMELSEMVSKDVKQALVEAFKEGYEPPSEHFNEFVGHNGNTFGFELHHTIKYALTEKAEKYPSEMSVLKYSPGFLFKLGNYTVSFYRVGRDKADNINSSFPLNKRAGLRAEMAEQLSFNIEGPSKEVNNKHVIVHIGNAQEGLLGLYLCEVGKTVNGAIAEWKNIYPIWESSEENFVQEQGKEDTDTLQDIVDIKDETIIRKRGVDIGKQQ